MKMKLASIVVLSAAALFSGCAIQPNKALVYSNASSAGMATNAKGLKTGVSGTCKNLLGFIATGDCSIKNAAKNGKIKTISTVDYKETNILSFISTRQTVVTGN